MTFRSILAVFFGIAFCVFLLRIPAAISQVGTAVTIGMVIQGLKDLAKQVEDGAQVLLQQGNTALAQQQVLAAGSIKALVEQLSETYKGRLNDTAAKVAIGQGNLADDVNEIIKNVQLIEKNTATDARKTIYQLQGSINQIVGRLPFISRSPVFYGMLVYDVSSPFPTQGFDLEFLGFNLRDRALQFKNPHVVVGGVPVPPGNVSVQEDRVQVVLTDGIKSKIGFRKDFCSAPAPFPAVLTVYYKTDRRYYLLPGKATQIPFNAFALAAPDAVVGRVSYSGITNTAGSATQTFSQPGSYATVGCEGNQSGSAQINLPSAATAIACNAQWINTSNLKSQTASCAVGGSTVTGSGTIRGLDKHCIPGTGFLGRGGVCNCPGGGHGTMQITGTYSMPTNTTATFSNAAAHETRFISNFEMSIPSDTSRQVQRIDISVARPQCSSQLDAVSMQVPADQTIITKQTSANGHFAAQYRNQRLSVQKVQ